MAPAQFGKDPECSVELTREKWGVSESSGGTPLGRCVVGVSTDEGGLKTETVGITSKEMVFSI